jgi:hypothetical protein
MSGIFVGVGWRLFIAVNPDRVILELLLILKFTKGLAQVFGVTGQG